MCVQGAIGIQAQLPKNVPKISSSPVAMKMAANSAQRGERRTKYAKTGRHNAPWMSTRPVTTVRMVSPATAHTVAAPRTT